MEALVFRDVLNPDLASWNSNLVHSTFNYPDASTILVIPPDHICCNLWMEDLLGSFSKSVRVRAKHAKKTRIGLWGQSKILKALRDVT
ncbi:hypothetical protein MTR_7g068660 [Medicago truncatula]|uniref:Uncharacterized protein n=1 Tax=Medicago truncatula TaxID=3880 RepID=A0A072U1X3_MEDTR|nr:hypothetical protein MTR_7g068660 [Medicago truncatula]